MKTDADRLYELLPAIYRVRDAEQGGPLRALVEVLAGQAAVLSASLDQLYDDQFVETAAPWVLPYLGDLLGIQGLPAEPLTPRAEVADTLANRRRKGTAHVLERLARGATGLLARAVEFFQLLAWTQNVNHVRRENLAWLPVRGALRLEQLGGAFERLEGRPDLAHNVDVRRIATGRGRYNIPNVGVFLWRLRAYPLTGSPAVGDAANPVQCFRFSPLGNDAPLFSLPATEEDPVTLAEPANVPAPISRRDFHDDLARRAKPDGLSRFYGGSVAVELDDGAGNLTRVPVGEVKVCDLSTWTLPHETNIAIAIDPVLGRLTCRVAQPQAPPRVTFHYGFPADLGGGEYRRGRASTDVGTLVHVAEKQTVFGPGVKFATTIAGALALLAPGESGVIEIGDARRYAVPAALDAAGRRLTLRARDGVRPTLVLAAAGLTLTGGENDAVTLDGLLLAGAPVNPAAGVVVAGPADGVEGVGEVAIRHCTLVPGLGLATDGTPLHPGIASLVVRAPECRVTIERSIVGPVRAALDAEIVVDQSILDATSPSLPVFLGETGAEFGASLTVRESTVIGKVKTDALVLASDTLFLAERAAGDAAPDWPGPVVARRRQEGCARFCYLPPGSRTPRRFQCIPRTDAEDGKVRPWPASTRYGSPRYGQLPPSTPAAVRRGASDEDEIGVYHHLYLSRREAHLRARLDEYLRFGLEAGVFYAS
jgi:hypothetical protein